MRFRHVENSTDNLCRGKGENTRSEDFFVEPVQKSRRNDLGGKADKSFSKKETSASFVDYVTAKSMCTPIGLGVRVVRGPDWKWSDQDGGVGFTGTVVDLGKSKVTKGSSTPDGTVVVHWDNGMRTNCRVGHQNAFDLRLIDNAPIGVKHVNSVCKYCTSVIVGIRWSCASCKGVDLCTPCYMSDKHERAHQFLRLDKHGDEPFSAAVLMSPRSDTEEEKVVLRGIYAGAKVKRSRDWVWDDQDGGVDKIGKVVNIQDWDKDSGRSVANVYWPATDLTNVYRVGHKGKVDLECVQAATNESYYPDHLPVLGRPDPISVVINDQAAANVNLNADRLQGNVARPKFQVGEKVEVGVSPGSLERLQQGHGGFNPNMLEIIGKLGTVHRLTMAGDVRVQYPGTPLSSYRWTVNPEALVRVKSLEVGDIVQVLADGQAVKALQESHSGWIPSMQEALGQNGRVLSVYPGGDVVVSVIGQNWTFNPACLVKQQVGHLLKDNNTLNDSLEAAAAAGDLVKVQAVLDRSPINKRKILKVRAAMQKAAKKGHLKVLETMHDMFPDEVTSKHKGRTAMHVACDAGHTKVVEYLLSLDEPQIGICDDDGDSPLHYAVMGKRTSCLELLLAKGANPNSYNHKQCSVLHMAVIMKDAPAVRLLLGQSQLDVNAVDAYGDTPLHEAVVKDCAEITELLCRMPNVDFTITNQRGFSCFQYAALKGNVHALKTMLAVAPQMAQLKKDDGFTPLHLASLNGHLEAVRVLITEGHVDVECKDDRQQTALHCAAHQGNAAVVELLVGVAASNRKMLVNCQDVDGETALHVALSREGPPLVFPNDAEAPEITELVTKAKRLWAVPEKSAHALALAAFLVKSSGASLKVQNRRGYSPLNLVCDAASRNFLLDFSPPKLRSEQTKSDDKKDQLKECRICCDLMRRPVQFQPCGHAVVCTDCCQRMKKCIECQEPIGRKILTNDPGLPDHDKDNAEDDEVKSLKTLKLQDLQAKVHDWEEQYLCSICMERNKNIAFLCGHGTCDVCVETLRSCHMCRGPITKKINLY